ncbi:hypothetical protein DYH09_32070 [bacterium CPR1]|nr:hypothetical protein [bacterium CPR1]
MNRNANVFYSSHVDASLLSNLRSAGMMSALVDLKSFRVKSYWAKPKLMLQDGWRLAPNCDPRRGPPNQWILGDHLNGQCLTFDRDRGVVHLTTYVRNYGQEIALALETGQVVHNRLVDNH